MNFPPSNKEAGRDLSIAVCFFHEETMISTFFEVEIYMRNARVVCKRSKWKFQKKKGKFLFQKKNGNKYCVLYYKIKMVKFFFLHL